MKRAQQRSSPELRETVSNQMKQAIAGVSPVSQREATITTVWPSVSAMSLGPIPLGKILGNLYSNKFGFYIFTVGNFMCLATIPLALLLYALRILPFVGTRYRITNKRIIVERGLTGKEERSVSFDQFDKVRIQVESGQEWYDSGNLIFTNGPVETFRLEGVSRPDSYKHICEKAHQAFTEVQKAVQLQSSVA